VVSFPTFDADDHVKHFKDAPEGIKVLGADGKVSYQRGGDRAHGRGGVVHDVVRVG